MNTLDKTKYTPGPWIRGDLFDGKTIVVGTSVHDSEGGHDIWGVCLLTRPADICTEESKREVDANATLIASAPELLDVAKMLLNQVNSLKWFNRDGSAVDLGDIVTFAASVISKASSERA